MHGCLVSHLSAKQVLWKKNKGDKSWKSEKSLCFLGKNFFFFNRYHAFFLIENMQVIKQSLPNSVLSDQNYINTARINKVLIIVSGGQVNTRLLTRFSHWKLKSLTDVSKLQFICRLSSWINEAGFYVNCEFLECLFFFLEAWKQVCIPAEKGSQGYAELLWQLAGSLT